LETWKIDAVVTRAAMIVVARHPLGRGEMITEHDVELAPLDDKAPPTTHKPLTTLEEAIGKETTRPIAAGETILAPSVHETLMVRRGQVVTVYSRCGGVQIRTTGRAKENGSHGELIPIETIGSRESFHARVSGHQEVEIFAGAPTTPTVADAPREPTPYLASRRENKNRPAAPTNPTRRTNPR
jgi:flagella basal body P-ring formation protein FlgA